MVKKKNKQPKVEGLYNRAMMRHKGMGTLHWEWRWGMGWREIPEKESYFFFLIQNVFIGLVSRSSWYRVLLVLLLSERASFCKPCFSSCRLAEDSRAANTQNYCLCMAEDGGDFIASWAFYIHEIGIGALYQALLLVFPLLLFWRGMKKILCERHVLVRRSSLPESLWDLYLQHANC